jgi:tRNA A37 threonylcarbamoyladenosine synthetase subunit TsaC/SUA5/YrdC
MSASDITLSSGEHVLRPNIVKDASHAFEVVKSGGTAIWPNDVGYGIVGSTKEALQKIFVTKGRGDHKRNALLGDLTTQRSLHRLDTRSQEIIETITVDFNLPLGAIGPFQPEHPLLKRVDPELLNASTANGTVGMLLNAGPIYNELCRLSREQVIPIFGSSANLTGTGPRFRVEDIQPEILAAADVIIDYGLRKYHHYQRSATIIRFPTMEVVRIGICYELISDLLLRFFKIELPADPGRDVLPSGHLREFELAGR